jgi:hypothetical protein
MKKIINIFLIVVISSILLNSCLEEYLDKAPEAGLSQEEVFSKYENFIDYFNGAYSGLPSPTYMYSPQGAKMFNLTTSFPMYFARTQTFSWDGLTEMTDPGYNNGLAHNIKKGVMSQNLIKKFSYYQTPILSGMFMVIRICNTTLQNINMLTDATQEDKDDLIAQAHFARAYAHFELVRWWGGMPYLTRVIGSEGPWDIPRLTPHETLLNVAADMDTAYTYYEKAGRIRRDPGPGQAGHLNHPDMYRPNGVAAKAYKARALLYAASPLNNTNGAADWEAAALANWEAIKLAEQYGYGLLTAADYKTNFVGAPYTNEQLWGRDEGRVSRTTFGSIVPAIFSGTKSNSGHGPTQNAVDKFETKWGDPLNTQQERDAATALGHYNEQDPYKDRDPRFYIDIIYNQAPLIGYGKADIYYEMVNGVAVYGFHFDQSYSGITRTGYYDRKHWGDQSVKNNVTTQYTDPLIRLGELYLNYAEAANEAYGPSTAAPGATMTAVQAINLIRQRIGHAEILPQYTTNRETIRPRIKNERNIELIFEGHYYHDIRRWKDAPVCNSNVLMGYDIEKVPVSAEYPTGFKYTRKALEAYRQTAWTSDAMYYLPFITEDNYKMKTFTPNPLW